MAKKVEITQGTKIESAQAKKLDRAKMGVTQNTPPQVEEVEAQSKYWQLTECPWCSNIAWSYVDSSVYLWFTCCNCGRPFKA